VQIAVFQSHIPRHAGIHILHDHEVGDVGRRVTDYRVLRCQDSGR
jgi:hypothetical protein